MMIFRFGSVLRGFVWQRMGNKTLLKNDDWKTRVLIPDGLLVVSLQGVD